ncbi:hypothetical protein ACFE04_012567 [Oxalis oulophora]
MSSTTNTASTPGVVDSVNADELAAKTAHKRYEGLVTVRTKAVKGKGAWYWAHLEPMLVHNSDTGLAKAVKLRCSLCDAVFSASNPSRTASEHLKRGTCPNFNSLPKPISSISPTSNTTTPNLASPSSTSHNHRKRSSSSSTHNRVSPITVVDPSTPRYCSSEIAYSSSPVVPVMNISHRMNYQQAVQQQPPPQQQVVVQQQQHQQQHFVLSGGREDLGALAMLEDSVKKLKSPKTSPGPSLTKTQIDSAFDFLADWVYECCGSVSFTSLQHPKFKAFLQQVGLPPIVSRKQLVGTKLDLKYEEVKVESDARIRDAMFFQIAANGWKRGLDYDDLVNLTVNLPNGTSLYRRAVFINGASSVPSEFAEDVLRETITEICRNAVQQCVGIVADRFKSKALQSLENQYPWMVNLSCQFQGFNTLIKDLYKNLPLFKTVSENCLKIGNFVNNTNQIRISFQKHHQLHEAGCTGLIRVPCRDFQNYGPMHAMLEDILNSAQALQLILHDEAYKIISMENPVARDVADLVSNVGFWNELEAAHSLINVIKEKAQEIENEKPLIGQCLPIWDELRSKVKDWCSKYHIFEVSVEKLIERRFQKNYHPAWAAAFVLDPLYLIRDTSGKYLPPFKCLTPEQEKDVDRLITRLVSREEAHIALMELMKWRTEGLDPVYARAVQMKERDPVTGKMRIVNPQSSRLVWETYLTEFKSLGKVAVRLIFLHATSCGFKCNWSLLRWVNANGYSRAGMEKAQKLIFIAAHSKLERRDFTNDEEKDAELLALVNGEDDVLNDVYVDTSSA